MLNPRSLLVVGHCPIPGKKRLFRIVSEGTVDGIPALVPEDPIMVLPNKLAPAGSNV
jgi:hypothetical protein